MKKKLLASFLVTAMLFPIGVSAQGATGWAQDGTSMTYLQDGKRHVDATVNIDGYYYYFDKDGHVQKGWIQYGTKWLYGTDHGYLATGWRQINDKWYYFANAGVMLTGNVQLSDGKYYNLASDGHLIE